MLKIYNDLYLSMSPMLWDTCPNVIMFLITPS